MRKRSNGMLLEESSASLHLHRLVQGSSARAGALRICAGALALALSANLEIPLQPVPFTLQILALGFIAATLKPKEAASAAGAYVAAGALGAPVFAGGLGGVWRVPPEASSSASLPAPGQDRIFSPSFRRRAFPGPCPASSLLWARQQRSILLAGHSWCLSRSSLLLQHSRQVSSPSSSST